jgi:dihydroceramidase
VTDFCEANYFITTEIVEPFNAFSSLFITFLGIIGLFFNNPTTELRFHLAFKILAVIGLGSFGLHATLHWINQSSDEVLMLWLCWASLYILLEHKSPLGKPLTIWI